MAYIIGLFTPEEQAELEELGWEFEDAPKELIDPNADYDAERMKQVWVDTDAYRVMTGPDWQGSTPHVALHGNLSEGFEAYGPYSSFDDAVADTEYGSETWIMQLKKPGTQAPETSSVDRCGECLNCKQLERIRERVLACCNPPFSHADQDVVDLWNRELERLPCTGEEEEA